MGNIVEALEDQLEAARERMHQSSVEEISAFRAYVDAKRRADKYADEYRELLRLKGVS